MARKPLIDLVALKSLGLDKLAQIVLEQSQDSPAFRKLVTAVLASTKGPDAVAALIDRRLAALERGRAMVAWEREGAFAEDLRATVATITKELGALSPMHAVVRLLRFIAGHGSVFERIDDSGGKIQEVYWSATESVRDLVTRLSPLEKAQIPAMLTDALVRDTHGLVGRAAVTVAQHLPKAALRAWDRTLSDSKVNDERGRTSMTLLRVRQAIADACGDLDSFMTLEMQLPDWRQNPLEVAERLLAKNRLEEALTWARKEHKGGLAIVTMADIADGRVIRSHELEKVRLEAKILEAMKGRKAAQTLRWAAFGKTLNANILREYIEKLDDFQEQDELDRAFDVATKSDKAYVALSFFLEWPRLDLAAKLVLDRIRTWDGRHYGALGPAAEALEHEFPLAATVLYHALVNDILGRAKSKAYRHAAEYCARLEALSESASGDERVENHTTYVLGLRKNHGRKAGFWSLAKGLK